MNENYFSKFNRWSQIPYPNETRVPHGDDPGAGSWPLNYFKRVGPNRFLGPFGEKIAFPLQNPALFNFDAELKEVEAVQQNLTQKQIDIAKYWGNGVPLNQLIPIAMTLINTYKVTPARSARILAEVAKTINDAFVITWYYKFGYDYPRPTQLNRELETVLSTPVFPTYPSGHSVVSAAATTVLAYYFPMEAEKLNFLAEQASISRLYGGIHFTSDLKQGLILGRFIGSRIVEYLKTQRDAVNGMVDYQIPYYLDAPIIPDIYEEE